MEQISSGCYIVDAEYNVVAVNETARRLYPQLQVGAKCYKSLMGLDEPCGPCPVHNHVQGPRTYVDPIRHITETVDAVEMEYGEHGLCHALIFGTVGQDAEYAATLPTNAEDLRNLAAIQALTVDYVDVFTVRLFDGEIRLYRYNGKTPTEKPAEDPNESLTENSLGGKGESLWTLKYQEGMQAYIDRYVLEADRERVKAQCDLEYLAAHLAESESMTLHYRVLLNGELHYYYRLIVRIGDAASFDHVIIGVGCEDEEMEARRQLHTARQNLQDMEKDTLTGLYTREAFLIQGEKLLEAYPEKSFDFCISKLENLGLINHQYGRLTGDRVLVNIGRLLREYESDLACIAYLGDGAFASLTENTSTEIRRSNIEQFRKDIKNTSVIHQLSMKWSIYKNIKKNISLEEIYAKTTYALYTILADLHLDYVEFDQTIIERMEWEDFVDRQFEEALEQEQFVLHYQPKYSARTGRITGAEALVRWQQPDGRLIYPDKFISVLEGRGKIDLLDRYVFARACRMQKQLTEMGHGELSISVNLSRASMFVENLAGIYRRIADAVGVDPARIPIEITESAAVRSEEIVTFAREFIDQGFPIHMDDFGSGYSSLASLHRIPFESVKLDKSIIDIIGQVNGDGLIKHTIEYCKEMGRTVVAEGVETYEQLIFLRLAGADYVQGYYYSKPVEASRFLEMVQK